MACFATPFGLRYAAHCFNRAHAQQRGSALILAGGKLGVTSPRPPVWMASELMSFGLLSQWYKSLKEPSLRQLIADPFDIDERIFVTFVHQLAIVRNICAHHGRLWNRTLDVAFPLPRSNPPALAAAVNRNAPKKVYNTVSTLQHLLAKAEPSNDWGHRLQNLMVTLPAGREADMGFRANWTDLKLWGGQN